MVHKKDADIWRIVFLKLIIVSQCSLFPSLPLQEDLENFSRTSQSGVTHFSCAIEASR